MHKYEPKIREDSFGRWAYMEPSETGEWVRLEDVMKILDTCINFIDEENDEEHVD